MATKKVIGYVKFWIIWSIVFSFFNLWTTTSCPGGGNRRCFQITEQSKHLGWPVQYLDPSKVTNPNLSPPTHEGSSTNYGFYKLYRGEVHYFNFFLSGQLFGLIMSIALTSPVWIFALIAMIRRSRNKKRVKRI